MRYLKKFESFTNDDNRGEETQYPQLNVALKGEVTDYVDSLLNSNDYHQLVDILGMETPQDISGEELDQFFDEVREKAIAYFMKNPEEVRKTGFTMNRFTVGGGDNDGIARTNNVGGAMHESNRPDPGEKGSVKLSIGENDLDLFETESPLINLITDEKVVLFDSEVWYNKGDKETIEVLDTYFEM